MKNYFAHNKYNKYSLLDGNKQFSIIHKIKNAFYIYDNSSLRYKVTEFKRHHLQITSDSGYIQDLEIHLSKDKNITRPPKAETISLKINNEKITLSQKNNRAFIITADSNIGEIKNIYKNKATISISKKIDEIDIALIYSLAIRMLYEDDIDII